MITLVVGTTTGSQLDRGPGKSRAQQHIQLTGSAVCTRVQQQVNLNDLSNTHKLHYSSQMSVFVVHLLICSGNCVVLVAVKFKVHCIISLKQLPRDPLLPVAVAALCSSVPEIVENNVPNRSLSLARPTCKSVAQQKNSHKLVCLRVRGRESPITIQCCLLSVLLQQQVGAQISCSSSAPLWMHKGKKAEAATCYCCTFVDLPSVTICSLRSQRDL